MQRCILDLCVFAAGKTCSNNLRCVNAFALVAHWSLLLNEVVLFALNRAKWHPLFKKGTGKKNMGGGSTLMVIGHSKISGFLDTQVSLAPTQVSL